MARHRFHLVMLTLLAAHLAMAAELQPGFIAVHGSEPLLLHRQIEPTKLRALKIWDTHLANWRVTDPKEAPIEKATLLVLHLWADWCKPCVAEFPALRGIIQELDKTYGGRVQVVLLSETATAQAMRVFLDKEQDRMPRGSQFLDTEETIAESLRNGLPMTLPYPVTLVLDPKRVVRHAIVGPITARRGELLTAISRLMQVTGSQAPAPIR